MTALFLVILINQWREQSNHLPPDWGVGLNRLSVALWA